MTSTEIPDLSRLKIGNRAAKPAPTPEIADVSDIPSGEIPQATETTYLPEPKSAEIILKEEEQRIIISLYKMKFNEELSPISMQLDPIYLSQLGLSELEMIREKCDKLLGAGSGCESKKKMMNLCLYVIEKVGCLSGVYCEGLTSTLLNDKDYQRDITRLALKYLSGNDCKPELTVPMKILSTCVQLHANNEIARKQQQIEQKLSSAESVKKINDVSEKFDNIA